MKIKYLIYLVILIPVLSWADVIEWQDDDRVQWLTFEDCDPDSIAQVVVGFSLDLDSGYVETMYALTDTADFRGYFTENPDRDQNGNAIPGRYEDEYWFYVNNITHEGDTIAAPDTNHVAWGYTIPQPCGGKFYVD